jgi:phytanoyl-CoA hydroxylase
MIDLHAGRTQLDGFELRRPGGDNEWGRTHNQHVYDPLALEYLVLPCLRAPLRDCLNDEAEGIQTMYFWKGSEQRRHQDQYYLPGCMSAWLAFIDVSRDNGTIQVQPGSHRQRLLTKHDFAPGGEFEGWDYNDAVDAQFERNEVQEVPVEVPKGSVVFFHGVLVHRGGDILEPGSDRHVLANHYIARGFDDWPHRSWTRHDFDGGARLHPAP